MSDQYVISGNTFPIKKELKAHACIWDSDKKAWITPELEKDELSYLILKSVVGAAGASMVPLALTGEAKKIQAILNNPKLK